MHATSGSVFTWSEAKNKPGISVLASGRYCNDAIAYDQDFALLGMEFIDSPERQDVLRRIEKNGSRSEVRETAHKIEAIPEEQVRKDACQAVKPIKALSYDRN